MGCSRRPKAIVGRHCAFPTYDAGTFSGLRPFYDFGVAAIRSVGAVCPRGIIIQCDCWNAWTRRAHPCWASGFPNHAFWDDVMKRRDFLMGAACATSLFACTEKRQIINEIPLRIRDPRFPKVISFEIQRRGRYCLDQDWHQKNLSIFGHSSSAGSLVHIYCGDVVLDLFEHTLRSDFDESGILLNAKFNRDGFAKHYLDFFEDSLDNRFVSIYNGTINLADGDERTWSGISLRDAWSELNFSEGFKPKERPENFDGRYIRNEYRLENLKIYTQDIGVFLEGSHNVIRNCVIHSAGQACIVSAGPNITIENCEIWLKPSSGRLHVAPNRPRAAIILADAHHAVIRNNRIRVSPEQDVQHPPSAIFVRDAASNVLIEGNTFINTTAPSIQLFKGSQAIVRDNKNITRQLPW